MNMNEWTPLPTMQDVACAQVDGWEIEYQSDPGNDKYSPWKPWKSTQWMSAYIYRGRPAQPKKVAKKLYGYLTTYRMLVQVGDDYDVPEDWTRFPAGDLEGEVKE